ncbi:decarboxylase [Nanoarchaeota archaeon]
MRPYFTISNSIVLAQHDSLRPIADIISYSSKTNPDITPILEQNTDCMFSIHAANELIHIKDLSRVLFLAQAWNREEIQTLLDQRIANFVVDNESDLEILLHYLANNPAQKIHLQLRLKLKENTLRTERYFVFGMTSDTIIRRIHQLKDNHQIQSLGIHFHRKTQNMAEWNLKYELQQLFPEEILKAITIINIGGGLPSNYANTNQDVIHSIKNKIQDLRTFLNQKNIKLLVEPGRFIAAPAGKLITQITQIYDNNIIINASVYNSDMDAILVPVKLLVKGELQKTDPEAKPFIIKGSTPCSLDLFRYRVYLNNPKVGNTLTFRNAGAYNFASDFCDLDKIETKIID